MLGVTPEHVYQRIAKGEIDPPTIKISEQQKVYSLDEALKIWKENKAKGVFWDIRVSSDQSR